MLNKIKDKNIKIALIGASNNSSKYGYKIYKNLISKGYSVVPINQKEVVIDGIKTLPNVESMDTKPDIIDFVIPPKNALSEAIRLSEGGYDYFLFQPGSESEELESYLKSTGSNYLINKCIMVEAK